MAINNEVQSLSSHIHKLGMKMNNENPSRWKLASLSEIYPRLKKKSVMRNPILEYKKQVQSIWKQVLGELIQSPWQMNYWVDALAEVQEAATELGKAIYKGYKLNSKDHRFTLDNKRTNLYRFYNEHW